MGYTFLRIEIIKERERNRENVYKILSLRKWQRMESVPNGVKCWSYIGTKIFYLEKQSKNNYLHKFNSLGRCDGENVWKQSSMYFFFFQ